MYQIKKITTLTAMGKGKKKKGNKGKKRGDTKARDDTGVGDYTTHHPGVGLLYATNLHAATPEQKEKARLAAAIELRIH